uniref:Uncharacterized protein n=1 Tax=viral metagenome TaxID=1070528 RepID=A0A6C0BZV9_9ZZZZ
MQAVSTRNAIAHAVHSYETQRIRNPPKRQRKLSVAYILERIFVGIVIAQIDILCIGNAILMWGETWLPSTST